MTSRISSVLCIFIFVIWASNLSHVHTLPQELSSQAEAPNIPEELTNDQLRQLLQILDEPASKEVSQFDSHPLLHLGELLLDEDDSITGVDPTNADSRVDESLITVRTEPPAILITTTPLPTTSVSPPSPQISRRDDVTQSPQPTHEQLVQQLSLFNSLLMSLSIENATTPAPDGPPPLNTQQVALLKSLFGNLTIGQTTEASQFLKRQTESPSPSAPDIAALSELLTQIAKAPSDANGNLNLQAITGSLGNSDHLKNFHNSNANMDPAASNQLSNLLTLLGTLGSLTQTHQQLQPTSSLFNFGTTPTIAPPISNNFLAGLLQGQASQPSPNIFGNLFNQPQPHEVQGQQPFSFGDVLTPGLGSVISSMSNIFGGSGTGGKPRVRGKGVDTRLGLGYRFGDAADAQIMWDIGPQLFTDPIQNEASRYPMTKQKRHDSSQPKIPTPPLQQIQAAAQVEKEQQQLAASRRYFQLHQQNQYPTRRNYFINPPTTRKPSSHVLNLTPYAQEQALKELWQMMEMKKQMDQFQSQKTKQSLYSSNPLHMLTPADLYQMQRNKQIIKRASSTPISQSHMNINPTNPTVFKNEAEQHASESFLRFRKMPLPLANAHSSFSKKSVGPQRNMPQQSPTPQPTGSLFNFNNLFGLFRGPSTKPTKPRPFVNNSRPASEAGGVIASSPSQMSRWDMENHRFDNFKNTNGELVMTDSNANDRFHVRNTNVNHNRNMGFVGT